MDILQLEEVVQKQMDQLDRKALTDLKNDPLVLVTYYSGFEVSSFCLTVSYKDSRYFCNESLMQTLIGEAMSQTAIVIKELPFPTTTNHQFGLTRVIDISHGCVVIISVISNKIDAELIVQTIEQSIKK